MDQPLVSIILPVYNGEQYLKLAIDSMLSQTYTNFELIVIDDGSSDGSHNILMSYTDPRLRIIKNAQNLGLTKNFNKGIDLSNGVYIARMDADDIALPTRLEKQVNYLNAHPEVSLVDSIMEYIDEQGVSLKKYNTGPQTDRDIINTLPHYNCMGHSSIMARKEVMAKFKYRETDFEDYDLWLRFINGGYAIHKLPEVLLLYRLHQASYTISHNKKKKNHNLRSFRVKRFYWSYLSLGDKLKLFNLKLFAWMWYDLVKGTLRNTN